VCIVCNDAESGVRRVLLHNSSQCHLCRGCHRVRLVKDNQLVCSNRSRGIGSGAHGEDLLRAGKSLDLFADNVDAAVIGGVEFENHLAHILGAIDSACQGENGRRFACSGRAV